jgi:hypothetical protein
LGLGRDSRDGILERRLYSRFLGINSILLRLEFLSGFPSSFSVLKMLFTIKLKFSCFADFFVWIFKTREEYGFLQNPQVEGTLNSHGAKDSSLLSN